MVHPLHPASDQYAELVEAGRAGSIANRVGTDMADQLAQLDSARCREWIEDRDGQRLCQQPVVAVSRRADGDGVALPVCAEHGRGRMLATFATFIVTWLHGCSVCDQPATPYQLDASGRCVSCQP